MRQKVICLSSFVFLWLILCSAVFSDASFAEGSKDFYYGHISYSEIKNDRQDPVVIREGQKIPEIAILNLPLGPGDTIRTSASRRCEIQFDNGTIIRLDLDTEVKIETILAQSLSSRNEISNFLLHQGQVYVMFRRYNTREIFQFITPRAAVKLAHDAVAYIRLGNDGATDVQVERGKTYLLYGPDIGHLQKLKIKKGERAVVSVEHKVERAPTIESSDFRAWNEMINQNFEALHEGSYIPKPIQKLPPAVFNFAQKFGNQYGEWLWHDLYGYIWRPYFNNYYPWGTWQPYFYGSWSSYQGQLFWIPGEVWGWVPYHLGIWMWDESAGWVWLPGSLFSPAWAVWDFFFGYFAWRPWTLFDWVSGPVYYTGGFGPDEPPLSESDDSPLQTIRKDQLKKKEKPAPPVPKEMKKVYKTFVAALERGDEKVLSHQEKLSAQWIMLKKEDLTRPKMAERIIPSEVFLRRSELVLPGLKNIPSDKQADASREALKALERNRMLTEVKSYVGSSPSKKDELIPAPLQDSAFRAGGRALISPPVSSSLRRSTQGHFRDWNPDVRTALKLGAEISYSSRTNEVACPELGIFSRHIAQGMQLSGRGVVKTAFSSDSRADSAGISSTRSQEGSAGISSDKSSSGSSRDSTKSGEGKTKKD